MYQMYAYQKKYNAKSVTLLYPKTESVSKNKIEFSSEDNAKVNVAFIDLFQIKNYQFEEIINDTMQSGA